MVLITYAVYILITAASVFLTTILFTPQRVSHAIQNFLFGKIEQFINNVAASMLKKQSGKPVITVSTQPNKKDSELLAIRWEETTFCDNESGFPSMTTRLYNECDEQVTIARALFTIDHVGRLRNHVEGHYALSIEPWRYNVQFDPLFSGKSIVVDIATVIPPRDFVLLSFIIGQETSDVETPTLYHFHLQLEDGYCRKATSKPFTIAIPSPVKAKSYTMLEERANVIKENFAVIKEFSLLNGYCNPLAQKILESQSIYNSSKSQYFRL